MMMQIITILVLCRVTVHVSGSIRTIHNTLLNGNDAKVILSDGYMFASDHGPLFLKKGSSFIDIDIDISFSELLYLFFHLFSIVVAYTIYHHLSTSRTPGTRLFRIIHLVEGDSLVKHDLHPLDFCHPTLQQLNDPDAVSSSLWPDWVTQV